jgi:hypothetical protein
MRQPEVETGPNQVETGPSPAFKAQMDPSENSTKEIIMKNFEKYSSFNNYMEFYI